MRKSANGLYLPGANWSATKSNLKSRGFNLPNSPYQATIEAKKAVESVKSGKGTAADLQNRALMHEMRAERIKNKMGGGMNRTAANVQMVLPKVRQPLGSLMDKGVPFQVQDPDELLELRRWCNDPSAPVWMADYTFKPIGEIVPGDRVIGWETHSHVWGSGRRELVPTTVLAVNRRMAPETVKITFASGRTAICTPDHEWLRYYIPGPDGRILNGPEKSLSKRYDSEYAPLQVGSIARSVINPTEPLADIEKIKAASWLAGIIDGEGAWSKSTVRICQSQKHNPEIVERIDNTLELLGVTHRRRVVERHDPARGSGHHGGQMVIWDINKGGQQTGAARKNRQQLVDLYNWARPTKFTQDRMDASLLTKNFGEAEEVVSIESLGPGEVISMQTTTGNYTAWGLASKNCRLFYSTHHLIPLLVDIYSKFPVTGMEFVCLAAETPIITDEGVREIRELSGGVHRILTVGGKWREAPFKSFGVQALEKVVVQRNGRIREFHATKNHRWFIHQGGRKVEATTGELKLGMRLTSSYGRNLVHATHPSPFGIAHGVFFGEKDADLLKYFTGCTTYEYGPRSLGAVSAIRVADLPRHFKDRPPLTESTSYLYGWLSGYFAADGTVSKKGEAFLDSARREDIDFAQTVCQILGIHTSDPYIIDIKATTLPGGKEYGPRTTYRLRLANESLTEEFFCIPQHRRRWLPYAQRKSLETWTVVSVEETDRIEEVYCAVVPETEAFTLDGNILTGNCKDPKIEKFYESMFMDDLNYEDFLPNGLLREYFVIGEVSSLAHFNEELGIWSSEEILNPDMIRVSKSLFVEQERVQLLVKDLVESLRTGPQGMSPSQESPSEKFERTWEYKQLVDNYPEIIQAAMQDDGLDISDALVSRMVNKAAWWDLRGTPFLLRSFPTLMLEESLNAAQDAVCDRLYAPLIVATLGLEGAMGDGEPWLPDPAELEDLRDDLQSALAADFKLIVHNFGLQVTSVFGRESVPRFDTDFDRITSNLLTAWGIGQSLIMGGTGAGGTYASSAINREVCEQLMRDVQLKAIRHMRKRMEIVAEAQEHYDFEMKGGIRKPIYREIVEYNEETGEQEIVRVPKLLIPDIKFACVVPGTDILTPSGMVPVEEIKPGDEVIAFEGNSFTIDHALSTGIEYREDLVEVTTKTGKTVRCTSDHPFWTKRGWVLARDLTTEDHIRTSVGQLSARIDSAEDIDLCRFLGLLVGDGNYSTTHVALSISDPEVDEFACHMAEKFGLTARKKEDKRTAKVWARSFSRSWRGTTGNTLNNPLHILLRDQGMWGQNGHTKRVPPIIWQAGEKGRAAFLSGYLDADGHVRSGNGLKLSSVNRKLLDDCQVLFESLGIRAQVHSYSYQYEGQKAAHRPQQLHALTVCHKHYLGMSNDVLSPLIERKAIALEEVSRPPVKNSRPNFDQAEWDGVGGVFCVGSGDVITLGIAEHHTHITAGLVSHNTLNLRDEATERSFVSTLKQAGIPISDKTMAINIPFEFEEELERQSSETYDKGCAQAESYKALQERCDSEDWPYPAELNQHLQSTIQTRAMLAQAEMAEGQNKQMDAQIAQASPAGMMGLLPGTTMQPLAGGGSTDPNPADGQDPTVSDATPGQGAPMAAPSAGGSAGVPSDPSALGYGSLTASYKVKPPWLRASTVHGPRMSPPQMSPTGIPVEIPTQDLEKARNHQTRPPESDEKRSEMPKKARRKSTAMPGKDPEIPPGLRGVIDIHALKRMSQGPSSYKKSWEADEARIEAAIERRAATNHPHLEDLISDPNFYAMVNMQQYEREIQADWPAISAGQAPDAARLLSEMVEQYEAITGISVYGSQYIHASAEDSTAEGELEYRKGNSQRPRNQRRRGRK